MPKSEIKRASLISQEGSGRSKIINLHLVLIIVNNVSVGGFSECEHMRLQQAQFLSVVFVNMILEAQLGEIKLSFVIDKIKRPLQLSGCVT